MNLNRHSNLIGRHAFLSASSYHWLGYDEDKLARIFFAQKAAARGTELHAFANNAIRLGVRLPDTKATLNAYVNDAIGYRMTPEQPLYYSDNCFGTADALAFRGNTLRIHDLKTGVTEASVHQLEIYSALFCLEYRFRPFDLEIELRIYQNDDVRVFRPDPDTIVHVIDRIVTFDRLLNQLREEDTA